MTRTLEPTHPDVPPPLRLPRPLPRHRDAPRIVITLASHRGVMDVIYRQYTDDETPKAYQIQGIPMIVHDIGNCAAGVYVRLHGVEQTVKRHTTQVGIGLFSTSRWPNVAATQYAAAVLTHLLHDPTHLNTYIKLSDAKLRALTLPYLPVLPDVDDAIADMNGINTATGDGVSDAFKRNLSALSVLAAAWTERHFQGHAAGTCPECDTLRTSFLRGLVGHLIDPHLNALMNYLGDVGAYTGEHHRT